MRYWWLAFAVIILDQVGKLLWAYEELNEGFAFVTYNLPQAVALLITAGLFVMALRFNIPTWIKALLLGGIVSNAIDRIIYGGIRDFIPAYFFIFNLADAAIILGALAWYKTTKGGEINEENQELGRYPS